MYMYIKHKHIRISNGELAVNNNKPLKVLEAEKMVELLTKW